MFLSTSCSSLIFIRKARTTFCTSQQHTSHSFSSQKHELNFILSAVDPTRSTDRRDSLLNRRKNVKRKCGLIFEFWKIRPQGGTVLLWSRHLLLFLFLNGEKQVRTKNPNDSSMEKKRSAKTRFLDLGIRLPIGKVPHMR